MPRTAPPGKFRRARLIKEDYEVRVVHEETGAKSWVRVTQALQFYSPIPLALLWLDDGTDEWYSAPADLELWSRTPAEARRASEVEEAAAP